jgi:formylglycine-generating enzyme required for sulfatase activity
MVLIPAGEFTMGSDPGSDPYALDDEQPQHTLYLPDYYLAKTPVTNAQYAAFVQAASHDPPSHWDGVKPPSGKEDHPVVNVTWHDAMAYSNWLAQATGKPYRLPSEAEWEKGARGSDGRIYPWGNQWDAERCNCGEGGKTDTTPVGAYPEGASPYGLLDMAGNVNEWTWSADEDYPYDPEDGREDLEVSDAAKRVWRGGAFFDSWRFMRCASRHGAYPDGSLDIADFGFRIAVAPGF